MFGAEPAGFQHPQGTRVAPGLRQGTGDPDRKIFAFAALVLQHTGLVGASCHHSSSSHPGGFWDGTGSSAAPILRVWVAAGDTGTPSRSPRRRTGRSPPQAERSERHRRTDGWMDRQMDRQQREPQVRAERGGSRQPSSCSPDPAAGAGRAPQDRRPSAFLAEQARAELVGQPDPLLTHSFLPPLPGPFSGFFLLLKMPPAPSEKLCGVLQQLSRSSTAPCPTRSSREGTWGRSWWRMRSYLPPPCHTHQARARDA